MSNARDLANVGGGGVSVDSGAPDNSLVVNSSGNVGIGTSSPAYTFDARLSGTSSGAVIQVGNTGSGGFGGLGVSDGGTYPLQIWGSSLAFLSGNSSYASATERMRIDSAGRVTMPYQPAFSASSTYTVAYQTITPSAPFPFDGTRINIGGHYSTSTYRFTAPINGLYEFHMNVFYEIGQGASNHDSMFYVNGAQLVTTTASGVAQCASRSGTDRTTSMLTALIQLSTNDYVEVRARSTSSDGIFGPHSYFSGRLVG